MDTITREDIENIVSSWIAGDRREYRLYYLLVLNRIEGHLARLVENTSETPELTTIAEKLSRIASVILDK